MSSKKIASISLDSLCKVFMIPSKFTPDQRVLGDIALKSTGI